MVEMFSLPQFDIIKLSVKPQKEKEMTIYWKITPPKTLVDWEGWKVSLLKCMYVTRLPILIQVIWLKGSKFAYVAKKLLNIVVLVE
jgi:hypothetical protein